MGSTTVIRDNYMDYSYNVCTFQIPNGLMKTRPFEIRRSHMSDAAFIIIDDGKPRVVDQCDIWKTIQGISEELFTAFGIYIPEFVWSNRTKKQE